MATPDDSDRDAILARRQRFVARALEGFGGPGRRAGRVTKVVALSLSGLTTACPCLKVIEPLPTEGEGEGEGDGDPGGSSDTAGDGDPSTGATTGETTTETTG